MLRIVAGTDDSHWLMDQDVVMVRTLDLAQRLAIDRDAIAVGINLLSQMGNGSIHNDAPLLDPLLCFAP
jgi:hypothetical protein